VVFAIGSSPYGGPAGAIGVSIASNPVAAATPSPRTFFMGFTSTEYDATSEALAKTYEFIGEHGDLVAHHLAAGVPWPEAYDQKRYHPAVERDLMSRAARRRLGQKVLVSVSPITVHAEGLGGYWAEKRNMPRPGQWKYKDFDDPQVITAYTNFAGDLISRLRPDFLAYGIEVNELIKDAPAKWPKFVRLAKVVYAALKAEYPKLPVFVSLQADDFWADPAGQGRAIKDILPYTDYVAVSAFPYLGRYPDPRAIPKDYFSAIAALAPGKPFLVAATGFPAKDVAMLGTNIPGRDDWQEVYVKLLLTESQRLRARAVVWFVPRDYDPLIKRLKALRVPQRTLAQYAAWQADGLVDALGTPRKALGTWMSWQRRPRRN
jgi:hypothetical protein